MGKNELTICVIWQPRALGASVIVLLKTHTLGDRAILVVRARLDDARIADNPSVVFSVESLTVGIAIARARVA